MISKEEYRETQYYKESIELINDFINDVLHGDINKLKTFCFRNLKDKYYNDKYCHPRIKKSKLKGWKFDCDDTALARAIYCVIWGNVFGLEANEIGPYTKAPYRGDAMNSFNTLFGKVKNNELAPRAKSYGLNQSTQCWGNIISFYDKYHTIGNFILIPNKGNINGGRANFKAFADYFDLFLLQIQYFIEKEDSKGKEWFKHRIEKNPFYSQYSMNEIKNIFFLNDYIDEEGKVTEFIAKTPTDSRLNIVNKTKDEHEYLVYGYISASQKVINNRAHKIIESLKEEFKFREKNKNLSAEYNQLLEVQ